MRDLKGIWKEHSAETEKHIRTLLCIVAGAECFLASNKFTGQRLFIIRLGSDINTIHFQNVSFRGLHIQVLDFGICKELTFLLLVDELEDIFISFIQDILNEINLCEDTDLVLTEVSNVIFQWRKFFEKTLILKMSEESEKGLFGELLFFRDLAVESFSLLELENAWEGPLRSDQDYNFNDTAIEIKLTSSKHASFRISNERQLDTRTNDRLLYLFLFVVEETKSGGVTLTGLVEQIRVIIGLDMQVQEKFTRKINAYGYFDEDAEYYSRQFLLKNTNVFQVNNSFPRIVADNLDKGVFDVTYQIELSACEKYRIDLLTITELILWKLN